MEESKEWRADVILTVASLLILRYQGCVDGFILCAISDFRDVIEAGQPTIPQCAIQLEYITNELIASLNHHWSKGSPMAAVASTCRPLGSIDCPVITQGLAPGMRIAPSGNGNDGVICFIQRDVKECDMVIQ